MYCGTLPIDNSGSLTTTSLPLCVHCARTLVLLIGS
jgi:hypothetical protein